MHIDPLLLYDLKQYFLRYVWIVDSKGAVVVGLVSFVEFGLVCALGRKVPAETGSVLEVYFAAVAICFPVVFWGRPVFLAEFRGVEMLPAIAYIMNLFSLRSIVPFGCLLCYADNFKHGYLSLENSLAMWQPICYSSLAGWSCIRLNIVNSAEYWVHLERSKCGMILLPCRNTIAEPDRRAQRARKLK